MGLSWCAGGAARLDDSLGRDVGPDGLDVLALEAVLALVELEVGTGAAPLRVREALDEVAAAAGGRGHHGGVADGQPVDQGCVDRRGGHSGRRQGGWRGGRGGRRLDSLLGSRWLGLFGLLGLLRSRLALLLRRWRRGARAARVKGWREGGSAGGTLGPTLPWPGPPPYPHVQGSRRTFLALAGSAARVGLALDGVAVVFFWLGLVAPLAPAALVGGAPLAACLALDGAAAALRGFLAVGASSVTKRVGARRRGAKRHGAKRPSRSR